MKHSRRVFRRAKRPTVWLAAPMGYVPNSFLLVPAVVSTQVLASSQLGPKTAQPTIERFRVERIVGDITWRFSSNAGGADALWMLSCGIALGDEAQGALEAKDPSLPAGAATTDAEDPWMWLRHTHFENDQTNELSPNGVTNASRQDWHIDIRVKRLIRPSSFLGLWLRPTVVTVPAATLQVQLALRVLLSRTV